MAHMFRLRSNYEKPMQSTRWSRFMTGRAFSPLFTVFGAHFEL